MMNKQRGYNIVEIAIVLVVSAMMASWLAINFFQVEVGLRGKETKRAIVSIEDAIIGYAADHSVKSYLVMNDLAPTGLKRRWRIPAGRPYLPCPDVTGDGVEDRRPLLTMTVQVIDASIRTSEEGPLAGGGDCYRQKGMVPWRTLGVPAHDPWGNFYTYRVSRNFSNAAIGFDQYTRDDEATYARLLSTLILASGVTVGLRATIPPGSALVRSVPGAGPVFDAWNGGLISDSSPSIVCENAPCLITAPATLSIVILAGVIVPVATTISVPTGGYNVEGGGYARFSYGDTIEGVPIVILSHGENGHGAIFPATDLGGIGCRAVPEEALDEAQNAFWAFSNYNAIKSTGTGISRVSCESLDRGGVKNLAALNGRQNGFVSRSRVNRYGGGITTTISVNPRQTFDDIVDWMSTDELIQALEERGVLPAELLPPIGLEEY